MPPVEQSSPDLSLGVEATGLAWRPLTGEDVPAWHDLRQTIEDADALSERASADDLLELLLDGPGKDPERQSLVGVDAGGAVRAWAHVDPDAEPVGLVRVRLTGGVHPAWRRRGIGRSLLAWQLRRAQELVDAAGHGLPAQASLVAEARAVDREALAAGAGLVATRWYPEMVRPLVGPRAPELVPVGALPAGLGLAVVTPDLDEEVRLAHNAAFTGHFNSQPRSAQTWRRTVSDHRDLRRAWCFAVVDEAAGAGRRVAGYTVASAYEQDWVAAGGPQGYTDLLGVRAEHRGRGLGRSLLAASVLAMAADGMVTAALGVDSGNASGAMGLYRRLGYEVAGTEVMHAVDLPTR